MAVLAIVPTVILVVTTFIDTPLFSTIAAVLAIGTAIPFYFYFKKVNADLIAEKKAEHDAPKSNGRGSKGRSKELNNDLYS